MEKGNIQNFNTHSASGTITDDQGRTVNFTGSSVSGRDRSSLKTGDNVWFERLGASIDATAINIRKC